MKDPVVIVWGILTLLAAIWSKWALKRHDRSLDGVTQIHILAFALASSAVGCLMPMIVEDEIWALWVNRAVLLLLGILQVWSLYRQTWTVRDRYEWPKDSIHPELAFTTVVALLCSVCYVLSPRALGFFNLGKAMRDTGLWDAPLYFLLPLLIFKLADWAGQVPWRSVEAPWFTPVEVVNPEKWPWRDLMRVEFSLATSLVEQYTLFGRHAEPWIEVPREAQLGATFVLTMQVRRTKQGVRTIQDLGNEYDGAPKFWWLFSIKRCGGGPPHGFAGRTTSTQICPSPRTASATATSSRPAGCPPTPPYPSPTRTGRAPTTTTPTRPPLFIDNGILWDIGIFRFARPNISIFQYPNL